MNWQVHSTDETGTLEIKKNTAYFPAKADENTPNTIYPYVKISTGKKSGLFKSKPRNYAEGNDIIVDPVRLKRLGGNNGKINVTIQEVSEIRYFFYSLFREHFWLTIGFIFGLSGAVINGMLKAGEYGYGIECSADTLFWLRVSSIIIGIVGVILLFVQGLKK
ncbi:MAG TPA: hypothetical protein PKC72_07180 [Chitinophagaceae bacterium]|nr:hypothetical protein [Chitinophagaceae bacterium]